MSKDDYISSEKKFSCAECGQKFVSERAKMIHETTMHDGKEDENLSCAKCSKNFKSKAAMRTHMEIYHANDGEDGDDEFKVTSWTQNYFRFNPSVPDCQIWQFRTFKDTLGTGLR